MAEKRASKSGGRRLGRPHDDGRLAQPVHRPLQPLEVEAVDRGVEGHDLAPGVDAGVGATGDGQLDLGPEDALDGGPQGAAHGDDTGVLGEPVEVGAVVGDQQADPMLLRGSASVSPGSVNAGPRAATTYTSSMRAIGALSPWRVPSFRMRV